MKALKYDTGKLRYDLVPYVWEEGIAGILTYGSNKYADNSWQLLPNGRERYYAAGRRHLSKYRKGELLDKESGLPHVYHAVVNFMMMDSCIDVEIVERTSTRVPYLKGEYNG